MVYDEKTQVDEMGCGGGFVQQNQEGKLVFEQWHLPAIHQNHEVFVAQLPPSGHTREVFEFLHQFQMSGQGAAPTGARVQSQACVWKVDAHDLMEHFLFTLC